jgi:integrase/recombinase XerD
MITRFRSRFGTLMRRHLKLRRALGYLLRNAEYTLRDFDCYLRQAHPRARRITRTIIVGFLETTRTRAPSSRRDYLTSLRQFCRFVFLFDQKTYIPEARLLPPGPVTVKPYIYSDHDLAALMREAAYLNARSRSALLTDTYTTILGLLWVTGLRIGEVAKLNLQDVDLDEGVLIVRQSKFKKSRLVPLHPSTVQVLRRYRKQRLRESAEIGPAAPFFINRRRQRLTCRTLLRTIQTLAQRAGVRTLQGRTPRVHDFRHTFATRSLAALYQSGQDPLARLPVLATFLGHANIANTQVYLHPSIELLVKAGDRFAAHAGIGSGGRSS